MLRLPLCAGVVLITLSARGERLQALYLEGAELGATHIETFGIEVSEFSVTVNGMELPPEAVEEMGTMLPPTREKKSLRTRDAVLAVSDGQPTRVRRMFEELREHSLEEGEEQEKTGPLEGRTLVISAEEGETHAELEGDEEELDEIFLAGHRLTYDSDLLLPEAPVAVGDKWALSDEALRRFVDFDGGPVLFEPDEDEEHDLFEELLKESSTITGEVEFVEIEERDGLRCAALAGLSVAAGHVIILNMKWEVRIIGDEAQLRMLADAFVGPEWTVTRRGSVFFLAGAALEGLPDARAVRDRAGAPMASISAASMLHLGNSRPLEVGDVIEVGESRHVTWTPDPVVVRVSVPPVSLSVTHADGSVEVCLPADPVVEAALKADQSEAVERVLRLRNTTDLMWTDLYRILEAIQEDGGPVSASTAEVTRFERTANSRGAVGDLARHGRERTKPPPNPMKLREARALIDRIIRDWLASK